MPLALVGALLAAAALQGCADKVDGPGAAGDVKAGRAAIQRHQCGACHTIPGIAGARGRVGPPLTDYGRRVYIAGQLPRDATLLAQWIQNAPAIDPGTAMPRFNLTDREARDIAAYLYRLR